MKCSSNFLDSNTKSCEISCSIGFYEDNANNKCQQCSTKFNLGCDICSTTACSHCTLNVLNPLTEKCENSCPSSYFAD